MQMWVPKIQYNSRITWREYLKYTISFGQTYDLAKKETNEKFSVSLKFNGRKILKSFGFFDCQQGVP